jgi:hypothetical protein
VWASNDGTVPDGNCLAVAVDSAGDAVCPASGQENQAMSDSGVTWGPANVPLMITNLYAFTPDTLAASDAALVTVLVNGSPSALSSTVTGPGAGTAIACTSTATVTLSPGDFPSVEVSTAASGAFDAVAWRVSFSFG